MIGAVKLPRLGGLWPRQGARADPLFGGASREELEFLPAALEVMETPAPPAARAISLSIVALVLAAAGWALLGKVDIVATAPGRIVPNGGGKVIQPLETSKVASILVEDGQAVRAGDVLVQLEPTDARADRDALKAQLAQAELDVARLKTVALGKPFVAPAGADPAAEAVAAREAQAEAAERYDKLEGLNRQIAEHQSELQVARAELTRLTALEPIADQRVEMFKTLRARGFTSKLQLLDAEDKQQDITNSILAQQRKIPGSEAAIAAAQRERARAEADALQGALAMLGDAETKAQALQDELAKASARLGSRTLTAPVSGTVQEVSIHTIGGVVQPGQALMRIAPRGGTVQVEATLANRDAGFVRPGMSAEVKVESFPFTRYGTIPATVESLSGDSIQAPQAEAAPSSAPTNAAPSAAYAVRLNLKRSTIRVDGRDMALTPGMVVITEVKTGKRSIADYVLSPVSRATTEAARER